MTPANPSKPCQNAPLRPLPSGAKQRIVALLLLIFASAANASDRLTIIDEATLRAVTFIDADRGWAVGDWGVILKTEDGGLDWQPVHSATDVNLDAVVMFDHQRGVVVGGSYQPLTQIGIGTALWTEDAGETWKPAETGGLPPLRHLIAGSGGRCIAAGDWSSVHLTSVFSSNNGGRTWHPVPTGLQTPVIGIAGSIDDFVILDDSGTMLRINANFPPQRVAIKPAARVQHPNADPAEQDPKGRSTIASSGQFLWVDHCQPQSALSLASVDGGTSWQATVATQSPSSPLATFLWNNQRWTIAHGNLRLARAEGWSAAKFATPIADVPMRGLFRFDSDRGWSVGDWGTIALTRDGGETWRIVRGGNRRPAVMAVAATGHQIAWSLLAIESLQNNRRVALVTAELDPLVREAAQLVGPATHYQWRREADITSPGGQQTRPVAVGGGASPSEILKHSPPAVLVLDQHLTAAEKSAWTQAAVECGVQRIFETGRTSGHTLHNAAALANSGKLAGDVWTDALWLLAPGVLPPQKLQLGARYDTVSDHLSADGLAGFVGVDRRYVRSDSSQASRRHLQVLQARTGEAAWIEGIVRSPASTAELNQQIDAYLPRSAEENRQRLVWQLIVASQSAGKPHLYRAMLRQAAKRWPDQPLGLICQLHDEAIQQSSEWGPLVNSELPLAATNLGVSAATQDTVQWSPFGGVTQAVGETTPDATGRFTPSPVTPASATQSQRPPDSTSPNQTPVATTRGDAIWKSQPAVQMVATRGANLNQESLPPVSMIPTWVQNRPLLDGRLNDPIWQSSHTFSLDPVGSAQLYVAYDSDFVYFGVRGPRLAAQSTPDNRGNPGTPGNRLRDTPLDSYERFVIRIDVDGDWLTTYELEFNAHGATRDSCDGFTHWQPTWFIAMTSDPLHSQTEIAIKKSDLIGPLQQPGQHWNVSLLRLHPGQTRRSLALPHPSHWCRLHF